MSGLGLSLVLAGMLVAADPAKPEALPPKGISITAEKLVKAIRSNDAMVDATIAYKEMEITGTAKRINRTETGAYVLQMLPEPGDENFVVLHVDFEFLQTDQRKLGSILLPAEVTIKGLVQKSEWADVHDNHKHFKLVLKNCKVMAVLPPKGIQ